MAKAIIFDMAGVLLDSGPVYVQLIYDMFAEYGQSIPMEVCFAQVGRPYQQVIDVLLQYWPDIDRERITEIFQAHRLSVDIHNRDIMFQEVPEFLEYCQKRGIKTAIASGSTPEIIYKMVRDCGLDKLIDLVLSGENIPHNKPAPDIYLTAARLLDVHPKDCIVVEDSPSGIAAAKSAGIWTAARKHSFMQLDQSKADIVISSLLELKKYI